MTPLAEFVVFLTKSAIVSFVCVSIIFYGWDGAANNIKNYPEMYFIPTLGLIVFHECLGNSIYFAVKFTYGFVIVGITGIIILAIRNALPGEAGDALDGFWSIFCLFVTTALFTFFNLPTDTGFGFFWNVVFVLTFPKGFAVVSVCYTIAFAVIGIYIGLCSTILFKPTTATNETIKSIQKSLALLTKRVDLLLSLNYDMESAEENIGMNISKVKQCVEVCVQIREVSRVNHTTIMNQANKAKFDMPITEINYFSVANAIYFRWIVNLSRHVDSFQNTLTRLMEQERISISTMKFQIELNPSLRALGDAINKLLLTAQKLLCTYPPSFLSWSAEKRNWQEKQNVVLKEMDYCIRNLHQCLVDLQNQIQVCWRHMWGNVHVHEIFAARYRYSQMLLYVFLFSIEEMCLELMTPPLHGGGLGLSSQENEKKKKSLVSSHPIWPVVYQFLFPGLRYTQFPLNERLVLTLKPALAVSVGGLFAVVSVLAQPLTPVGYWVPLAVSFIYNDSVSENLSRTRLRILGVLLGVFLVWVFGAYVINFPLGLYLYLGFVGAFLPVIMQKKGLEYLGFSIVSGFYLATFLGYNDLLKLVTVPNQSAEFLRAASNRIYAACIGAILSVFFNLFFIPQRANREFFLSLSSLCEKSAKLSICVFHQSKNDGAGNENNNNDDDDDLKNDAEAGKLVEAMLQGKLTIKDLAVKVEKEPMLLWYWDHIENGQALRIAECFIAIVESFHLCFHCKRKMKFLRKKEIVYITKVSSLVDRLGICLNSLYLKLDLYCKSAVVFLKKNLQQQTGGEEGEIVDDATLNEINQICSTVYLVFNDFELLKKTFFHAEEEAGVTTNNKEDGDGEHHQPNPGFTAEEAIIMNTYFHSLLMVTESTTKICILFRGVVNKQVM